MASGTSMAPPPGAGGPHLNVPPESPNVVATTGIDRTAHRPASSVGTRR